MKKTNRILLRFLKISGFTLASVLTLLFLAPYLFPDTVARQIKQLTNQSIKGELNFAKARLSFFSHFPSLTLSLYDVELKGSAPYQQDTLLSAEKLGFGVNLKKLIFDHQVSVNKIYLSRAYIHVLVNEQGQANYNIYVSDSSVKTANSDSTASLHLEKTIINDSRLVYNDLSVPMQIQAEHLFYEGTGDLSKSIFDLSSQIRIDSLNFTINNQHYARRKAIDAKLITRINTKTLALIFEDNRIRINKLNFTFTGKLDFLKKGYNIEFSLSTLNADLYQLVTIFPPMYLEWLRKTKVRGRVNLAVNLKGNYIASSGQMPDFGMRLDIQDGFIAYQDARLPVSQLKATTSVELPALNPEKLHVKVDSLSFHIEKDFFRAKLESTGLSEPQIHLHANAVMDLQNLKNALGLSAFDTRGILQLQIKADGKYAKKIVTTSLRKRDTVIASIPSFDLLCSLKKGFIKFVPVTEPVQDIFISMHAACPDADYRHAYFKMDSLHAVSLKNFVEGRAVFHTSAGFPIDLNIKGSMDLADTKKIYPLDSMELAGKIKFDVKSSGSYAPDHHLFPKTKAHFSLQDGYIQTKYYPHAIEKINIDINARDERLDLRNLTISIQPASLVFEGKPFQFRGDFKNFEDLAYDISVRGDLDLGKIYQVFARSDIGLTGIIRAHADFKGKQSDAKNGRYDLLKNSGSFDVKDMRVTQELFPQPFFIPAGHFRFEQDKMWFENFLAEYGKSDLQLDGFVENVINYILGKNEILKANFNLRSKFIDLNEFSVYSQPVSASSVKKPSADGKEAKGVILVPSNLDLTIKAEVERISYNDMLLTRFQGGLNIRNGEIELTETGFELIGCQVAMNAKYVPVNPQRAGFGYHLLAKDFDVHRAYQQIKLFHDLASFAEHAAGIISLDYSLSGKLNEEMYPIYPSLKGSGILSVKNVKFSGWKLFNAVSSESGKSELKDPDLSKIDVKSSIKNNLITIEKLKFKTGGFRIRFEGQTSFDNKVNFKMRIGLPPLGIIGIPVRITGNADNPKIKMTKSDTDPLEEKEE